MANLIELFDNFAIPTYIIHTLNQGNEGKNIILIIDDITKMAVFQYNLYDMDGNLFEVLSQNKKDLYSSIHEFLKDTRSRNFKYDTEPFFTDQNQYLDKLIKDHIRDTFYNPDMPFYSVYNFII